MSGTRAFRWVSASRSDVGNLRKVNEDACLDLPERGLWVVADGMGGHSAGDVASQMLVTKLKGIDSSDRFSAFVDDVEDRVFDVNRRLYDMSHQGEEVKVVGTTLAAVLARGDHVVTMWVGDSRVYRVREGAIEQLTKDHSEVEELIAKGELDEESAKDHPAANIVTRAVGGLDHVFVDVDLHALSNGDRYVICSDGLYKDLEDDEIGHIASEGSCVDASRALVDMALERECLDNVTVVVVEFSEAAH